MFDFDKELFYSECLKDFIENINDFKHEKLFPYSTHIQESILHDDIIDKNTYPPEFIVNIMLDRYGLDKNQLDIRLRQNNITVIVFLAKVSDNVKTFTEEMDKCGYFDAQHLPYVDENGKQ